MRTGEEIRARGESLIGTPFKHLPGEPLEHKVLGRTSSGRPLTVATIEMVMNDAFLIDAGHGAGDYRSHNEGEQAEVYELAVRLYGCQPIDLHGVGFAEAAYKRSVI